MNQGRAEFLKELGRRESIRASQETARAEALNAEAARRVILASAAKTTVGTPIGEYFHGDTFDLVSTFVDEAKKRAFLGSHRTTHYIDKKPGLLSQGGRKAVWRGHSYILGHIATPEGFGLGGLHLCTDSRLRISNLFQTDYEYDIHYGVVPSLNSELLLTPGRYEYVPDSDQRSGYSRIYKPDTSLARVLARNLTEGQ